MLDSRLPKKFSPVLPSFGSNSRIISPGLVPSATVQQEDDLTVDQDHQIHDDPTIQKYYDRAVEEHANEVNGAIQAFGTPQSKESSKSITYTDEDYFTLDVGIGNAGPDENQLHNAHLLHGTTKPIFTKEECELFINEAREAISNGLAKVKENDSIRSGSSSKVSNAELGEAKVSDLPKAREFLKNGALGERLIPLLASRFDKNQNGHDGGDSTMLEDLLVYDALIIGHVGPTRSQPVHRDASILTLNVALSPLEDYDSNGGGTYFEALVVGDDTSERVRTTTSSGRDNPYRTGIVKIDQGHVLCHAGGVMHAGIGVESGERWVMVLFVVSKKEVQAARRFHAMGTRAVSGYDDEKPDFIEGEETFKAALKLAPNDHLYATSVGSIYNGRGDSKMAEQYLGRAAGSYLPGFAAGMALGQMLLTKRQPLCALKVYDRILKQIGTSDLREGAWMQLKATAWNARMQSAQCALIISQQAVAGDGKNSARRRAWAKARLPETIDRLELVLMPLQGGEQQAHVQSMINAATNFLDIVSSD